jgi:GT2 family glycosyltransferase
MESSTTFGRGLRLIRRLRWMARLRWSGLFDLDYYRAQRGQGLGMTRALWDFLSLGPDSAVSFNPLVDGAWVQSHSRRPARAWYATLFAPDAAATSTSPAFDVRKASDARGASSARVLREFLDAARDETALPVAERTAGELTVGKARDIAFAAVREGATFAFRNREREFSRWDHAETRRFLGRARSRLAGVFVQGPVVSIVMPARDRADSIEAAIRSVLAQGFPLWELIVIDDGSVDRTAPIAQSVDDERVRVTSTKGIGVSAARNLGLSMASGDYVAFLDADNEWTVDFLEGALGGLLGAGADYAYSAVRREDSDGSHYLGGGTDYEQMRDGANVIDLNALIIRREVIAKVGGFDESVRRWVDYELELRLVRDFHGVYCPFVGVLYDHRSTREDRITNRESRNWRGVVLSPHLVKWENRPRIVGRYSVIIVSRGELGWTIGTVRSLLETSAEDDVEVVVVCGGESASFVSTLRLVFAARPVRVVWLSRNHGYSLLANSGLATTTGEYVVFLNHVAKLPRGWTTRISTRLGHPDVLGIQPLIRGADGTIESAGTVFLGQSRLPAPFLKGLPLEDAYRAGRSHRRAISGLFLAVRAEDAVRLRGMDPHLPAQMADADFCLRLGGLREGVFEVLLDEVVTVQDASQTSVPPSVADRRLALERWVGKVLPDESSEYGFAGFRVVQGEVDPLVPEAGPPSLSRDDRVPRWAIKIAAPAATSGNEWGDRYFADELADALASVGVRVAVDRREAHHRLTAKLDDVAVFIRGRIPAVPVPGLINILWVISHPDDVNVDEVKAFDHVFAASRKWADWMTIESGRPVHELQQATSAATFTPGDVARHGLVFVGSSRGQVRPIVDAAARLDAALRVFGGGWTQPSIRERVVAARLSRDEVANEYRRADIVINDHWPDMARWGFVSNRIYDAVASGARVVSDRVDGAEDIFGDALVMIDDPADLGARLAELPVADEVTRRVWADGVRLRHTFAQRAEVLIRMVEDARRHPA